MGQVRAFAAVMMALVTIFALSACASVGARSLPAPEFDPPAASFINASGRAHVSGQAFVRQTNGRLWRAIGTDVFLVPRTPYADARIAALYGDRKQLRAGVRIPAADPLFSQYMRKTVATSGGSFSFDQVADGEYYLIAMIFLPGEFVAAEFPIMERVTVTNGRSVRVVMRGY